MKPIRFFTITFLIVFYCQTSFAQIAQNEKQRIERLAGLAKVWGAAKYFHPFLAYREIDWDKALVETIPQVNAAKSPQEYNAAINHLLSYLDDKETFAEIESSMMSEPPLVNNKSEFFYMNDGVLVVDLLAFSETGTIDPPSLQRIFPKIISAISQADAVIFDCRGKNDAKFSNEKVHSLFAGILSSVIYQISNKTINLGSARYRIHNGYAAQMGNTSGDYHSGLTQSLSRAISGESGKTPPPTIIIFNDKTPPTSEIFAGLQAANQAFLISEGEAVQLIGGSFYKLKLPDGINVKMRKTENVNGDGTIGVLADVSVPKDERQDAALNEALKLIRTNNLIHKKNHVPDLISSSLNNKDKPYTEAEFPSVEYRLLGLFRFWNIINYFYSYKDLIGEDWNNILPRYISKFEANKNAVDYQMTVSEMSADLHDSHSVVRGANTLSEKLGNFIPPLIVRFIEKQAVVKSVLDTKSGVAVGDVILAVDGVPIKQRRDFFSHIVSDSTPQAFDYRFALDELLRGQKDSPAKLTVRSAGGKIHEVIIARSVLRGDPQFLNQRKRAGDVSRILPGGFGYVDLERLMLAEVDEMFELIKNTRAVIFDMRGYPNLTAWTIAPRLTERKNIVGAIFSRPIIEGSLLNESDYLNGTDFSFSPRLEEAKGKIYKGKVVVLIDESAFSLAEHTCLLFEAATNVTFIGMPTMGVDGDVTNLILPGNLTLTFTGQSVRHADGRQLQRVGIQPTVKVAPTVLGVINNRDEIFEAAIKFLKAKK